MHATWTLLDEAPRSATEGPGLTRVRCHGARLDLTHADGRRRALAVHDEQQRPVTLGSAQVVDGRLWLLASREHREAPLLLTCPLPLSFDTHTTFELVELRDPTTVGCGARLDQHWAAGVIVLIREAAERGQSIVGNELQAWSFTGELLWRVYGRELEGIAWIDRFADNTPADNLTLVCTLDVAHGQADTGVLVGGWPEPRAAPASWRRELELEAAIATSLPTGLIGDQLCYGERPGTWLYATTHSDDDRARRSYHVARLCRDPHGITVEGHASGSGFVFGLWRSPGDQPWIGLGSEHPDGEWDRALGTLDDSLTFTTHDELPAAEGIHDVSLAWLESLT